MAELAEYLSLHGHEVTVITGFPNYPEGKLYKGYGRRLVKKEIINGINAVRCFLLVTPERKSFGPRLKNYVSFMMTAILGGLISGKHDLIYFYSPPLFLGITAGLLGKLWRASVVMELNDLWPRAPISLGIMKKAWQIRLAGLLESTVYKWSTKIFVYSHLMREEIIKGGLSGNKVEIHNLWIDSKMFSCGSPEEAKMIRRDYGLNGKFVGMYTGLVGLAQGLDALVEAAEILEKRGNNDIEIVIVGGGPEREHLVSSARKKGLKNILFIDQQPAERMGVFMAAADILISHLRGAPHRIGTIPAKILAYMAAGKPVLVCARGEAVDLVKRSRSGIAIPPDNANAIADALIDARDVKKDVMEQFGISGRQYVLNEFERDMVLRKLEDRVSLIVSSQ